MQLKLKALKIIQFALREFKQDSGILFSITRELIEREALKHEATQSHNINTIILNKKSQTCSKKQMQLTKFLQT